MLEYSRVGVGPLLVAAGALVSSLTGTRNETVSRGNVDSIDSTQFILASTSRADWTHVTCSPAQALGVEGAEA